jgi:hypothetical protein
LRVLFGSSMLAVPESENHDLCGEVIDKLLMAGSIYWIVSIDRRQGVERNA